jgi:pimeloyl-ACP methyl ester carboxylesterase
MRLIQRGTTPDLVLLHLVGSQVDKDVQRALGPAPWIIAFSHSMGVFLEVDARALGLDRLRSLVLVGYSAGCQNVRAALRTGTLPLAERFGVVLIDGTHASLPPELWQITVWRSFAEQARRGERLMVATCTSQTYTETLPAHQRFMATLSVLRQAVDETLAPSSPPDERHEGELHVYAYASARIDGPAHIAQQREVMPELLERHVRPWLDQAAAPDDVLPHERAQVDGAVALSLDKMARELA